MKAIPNEGYFFACPVPCPVSRPVSRVPCPVSRVLPHALEPKEMNNNAKIVTQPTAAKVGPNSGIRAGTARAKLWYAEGPLCAAGRNGSPVPRTRNPGIEMAMGNLA